MRGVAVPRARAPRAMVAAVIFLCVASSCTESGADDPVDAPSSLPREETAEGSLGFLVAVPKRDAGFYEVGVDGEGLERIAEPAGFPAWSPDGTRVAYHQGSPPQIWVMNADGSDKERLTDVEHAAEFPSWSHDGERIAFITGRWSDDVPDAVEVHVMNADGSDQEQVTDNELMEGLAVWSPDGDRLAVTRSAATSPPELVLVDLASGEENDVTPDAPPDPWIDWSPVTDRLAFTSSLSGTSIYTMTPEGTDVKQLRTDGSVQPRQPSWSPDGRWIAFLGEPRDAQVTKLQLISADGREMEEVLDEPWLILAADWVPRRGS